MINLIEHVIVDDFVAANEILESHLNSIVERKLYEKKRMMQAEVFGGMTKAELDARKKAGYRKATDVLGDPDKATKLSPAAKRYRETLKKKKVSEETLDELTAGDVAYGVGYGIGKTIRGAKAVGRQAVLAKRLVQHSMRKSAAAKKTTQQKPTSPFPTGMGKPSDEVDTSQSRLFKPSEIEKAKQHPSAASTYEKDKATAQALARSGDKDAVSRFKKEYRGYRAKKIIRGGINVAADAAGRVAGEIASYSNLEE